MVLALILGVIAGGSALALVSSWKLALLVGVVIAWVARPKAEAAAEELVIVRREPVKRSWF